MKVLKLLTISSVFAGVRTRKKNLQESYPAFKRLGTNCSWATLRKTSTTFSRRKKHSLSSTTEILRMLQLGNLLCLMCVMYRRRNILKVQLSFFTKFFTAGSENPPKCYNIIVCLDFRNLVYWTKLHWKKLSLYTRECLKDTSFWPFPWIGAREPPFVSGSPAIWWVSSR